MLLIGFDKGSFRNIRRERLSLLVRIAHHTQILKTKEQILEQIIWNNKFIKIEGLSLYYQEWHNAGISKVKDIFDNNKFLTPNEFCNKFYLKSSNFLKYLGLCSAIPCEWIRVLKDTHQAPIQAAVETVDVVPINKLSCKMATERLISKTFQPPIAERRMRQANLDDEAIKIIYKIPFNVTKDIRLAIF